MSTHEHEIQALTKKLNNNVTQHLSPAVRERDELIKTLKVLEDLPNDENVRDISVNLHGATLTFLNPHAAAQVTKRALKRSTETMLLWEGQARVIQRRLNYLLNKSAKEQKQVKSKRKGGSR